MGLQWWSEWNLSPHKLGHGIPMGGSPICRCKWSWGTAQFQSARGHPVLLGFKKRFGGDYPLVNSHITMENHHFWWENPLFQCSYVKLPEGKSNIDRLVVVRWFRTCVSTRFNHIWGYFGDDFCPEDPRSLIWWKPPSPVWMAWNHRAVSHVSCTKRWLAKKPPNAWSCFFLTPLLHTWLHCMRVCVCIYIYAYTFIIYCKHVVYIQYHSRCRFTSGIMWYMTCIVLHTIYTSDVIYTVYSMVCNRAIAYKPLALGSNVGSISHFVTMQDPALKSRDYIPWDITHLSQYLGGAVGLIHSYHYGKNTTWDIPLLTMVIFSVTDGTGAIGM